MTPETLIWTALAVAAGAFIQGSTGMGFALIVAPVLGLLEPSMLPIGLLVLMLPLNAHVAWRERAAIDFRGARWITLGRIAGTFGGLWVLLALPMDYLNVLIGVSTIAASLASLLAPAFSPNRRAYVSTGVITGITETATGIGGPPLALVYQHMPVPTLRASVALCFLIGELVSLAVLALSGKLQTEQLEPVLWMLPALLIGMLLSHWIHRSINARFLRNFVIVFAIVSGAFVLLKG
ncbi:permease [Marinobacterium nitratireducens]|uniref:Probable membrane transporter protein n=1 Tax=Marinobacterium nitratireducens TaxID=518897 RepID=A0A917ZK37_9GAMM|nr:sulfite exporter TauE/SafE family protein [Marinobacterium nitratireducens]GGO83569.1 permease [Marinobacterium nitratireducens]